jgi:hypothetical protein
LTGSGGKWRNFEAEPIRSTYAHPTFNPVNICTPNFQSGQDMYDKSGQDMYDKSGQDMYDKSGQDMYDKSGQLYVKKI